MSTFYKKLLMEENELQNKIDLLKKRADSFPEGILEICNCRGYVQYYRRGNSSGGKKEKKYYIKKSEKELAVLLAQRDYDRKLLPELEKRLTSIKNVRHIYEHTFPDQTFLSFTSERRKLIRPLITADEQFVTEWQEKKYESKPFPPDTPEIITARNERVRSKSEKIIADTLDRHGIPYKYEVPLTLSGGYTVFPDFVVLNIAERKEYLWEHLGMMDNESYAINAVNKINNYCKNGYFPGIHLILTFESSQSPLSTPIIEAVIETYLK